MVWNQNQNFSDLEQQIPRSVTKDSFSHSFFFRHSVLANRREREHLDELHSPSELRLHSSFHPSMLSPMGPSSKKRKQHSVSQIRTAVCSCSRPGGTTNWRWSRQWFNFCHTSFILILLSDGPSQHERSGYAGQSAQRRFRFNKWRHVQFTYVRGPAWGPLTT